MSEEQEKPIAQRFFDACYLEAELDEALMRAFGAHQGSRERPDDTDTETWPCSHMVYDPYDYSFELWDIKDDAWVPTLAQLDAAFALGFARCWLVYKDSSERYCTAGKLGARIPKDHGRHQSDEKWQIAKLTQRLKVLERATGADCAVDPAVASAGKASLRAPTSSASTICGCDALGPCPAHRPGGIQNKAASR